MKINTEADLDAALATPSHALVEDLQKLNGDITVLGAGGKLGPSLVALVVRGLAAAGSAARVTAVSRFADDALAERVRATGAEVIKADVNDDDQLQQLPDSPNVIFLVGAKFGTTGGEAATWMTNTYLPGRVAQRFAGSRIAALSTGNVYPLSPAGGPGCDETDPVGPVGEYAMSCLGRERVMTHFGISNDTPISLLRLNYAVELRYGVLVDLATAIAAGDPVDVTMGYVNVVWQGFCNEVILRSLLQASTPPEVINLTGTETLSVRWLATQLGERIGRPAKIVGTEADTALLSDASKCAGLFGPSPTDISTLLDLTADWVLAGGRRWSKPTHFQTRDGRF